MTSPLSSFSIPLPFIFQEAKESIDEEDPRPTSSNGAYITFSPVSKKNYLCIIMALVAYFNLELQKMDVKTTILNGDLKEEVYTKEPESFSSSSGEHLVCKLNKYIYGLKQAFDQWYLYSHGIISSFGFDESPMDQCIYHKVNGSKICFLILYVDDILLATNGQGLLYEVK